MSCHRFIVDSGSDVPGSLHSQGGDPHTVFNALNEAGYPHALVETAREGFRRTREVLAPFTVLLWPSRQLAHSIMADDDMPPEIMIGDVPGWALDTISHLFSASMLNQIFGTHRREINKVGEGGHYRPSTNPGPNTLIIDRYENFDGIPVVLSASFPATISPLTAGHLAELAIESARHESGGRDGISYLMDAKQNGIITPLSKPYVLEIDGKFKSDYKTSEDALKAGLELKKKFPFIQVIVYAAKERTRTLVTLPE
jgi:hypothetical protein